MPEAVRAGRGWPTLIGAVGIVVWASETVLIKLAGALPPIEMVALAFAAGTLASAAFGAATGRLDAAIFRQPIRAWLLIVPSLVGYHACIYFAVQRAPAGPAALLQGCTPLLIVLGSAILPGEHLRWWHWAGALCGLLGTIALVGWGGGDAAGAGDSVFPLILIAVAAGLWGIYSLAARALPGVPTAAMGVFFGAAAVIAGGAHFALEPSVLPTAEQWAAVVALGTLPIGLALYLWDFGVKRGDLQALSAFSYFEPFIAALLVAALGQGVVGWNVALGGALIVGGAVLASRGLWRPTSWPSLRTPATPPRLPAAPDTRRTGHRFPAGRRPSDSFQVSWSVKPSFPSGPVPCVHPSCFRRSRLPRLRRPAPRPLPTRHIS